jgi:hypothetical protein
MAARQKWWPDCNRLEAFIAGSELKKLKFCRQTHINAL